MPGFIGLPEIVLLFVVILLVFGPKKLPELGRGVGSSISEFKRGLRQVDPREDLKALDPRPELNTLDAELRDEFRRL